MTDTRALLRQLFDAAVAAAQPTLCLPPHLLALPRACTMVVGAGKALSEMTRVLEQHRPGPLASWRAPATVMLFPASVSRSSRRPIPGPIRPA